LVEVEIQGNRVPAQPGNRWRLMRASLAFNFIVLSVACGLAEARAPHASLLTPANMSCNAGYPTYLLATGYAGAKRDK